MNLPGVGFSSAVSKFKRKCLVSRSTTHYWSFTSLSCSWRRRNVPNEMRAVILLVCYTAVFSVVTQRSSPGATIILLTKQIIIRCKFFFLFIGREPTTWPANNCLQIMVCSCAMSSNCVWLQIIFCSCVNETTRDRYCMNKGKSLRFPKIFIKKQTWWSNDKTIMELSYRKISWFVSVSQINLLNLVQ